MVCRNQMQTEVRVLQTLVTCAGIVCVTCGHCPRGWLLSWNEDDSEKFDKDLSLNTGLVVQNNIIIFIIHSFMLSFIQQLVIKCLPGAGTVLGTEDQMWKNNIPSPQGVHSHISDKSSTDVTFILCQTPMVSGLHTLLSYSVLTLAMHGRSYWPHFID